ncbi:hypothetical protein BJ944DRAFT_275625 [Cunninghamella echinulata]|nr:hypothetical protein BJ944DRAFT_275625 [Cunninghamella echinulata]
MIDFEDIICSQGTPIEDSDDKYYISLFEDYGSITTYEDKLIGSGCGAYDEAGDIFTLEQIDKIWYIMLNNEYMAYDHQENDIKFIKDVPTKDQRLEFHQEDENHKSIMTISKWKQPNEFFVIEWITCSYGWIHIDNMCSSMRFQLVKYHGDNDTNNNTQNEYLPYKKPPRKILPTKYPRKQL